MTAQHAKGPWSRDKYGHVIDADGCEVRFRSMTTLACGSPESMAEAEANTTLAATAPELLEACEAMVSWIYGDYKPDSIEGQAIEKARAAVTKATGAA